MKTTTTFLVMMTALFLLAGCTLGSSASPTPTQLAPVLPTLSFTETSPPTIVETFTPIPAATATLIPSAAPTVCTDPMVVALIDAFKTSILTADGALLNPLVSSNGMEVRYFRNGNAINYLPDQAKFLFETTFEANWGAEPGSGMDKIGSFHDVIVPELVRIFNQPYTLHCNELKHGGATYDVVWPYKKDFYAIHFTGTEQYGFLDWHTWAVGVEYSNSKPYIYALMQFYWEP